MALKVNGAAVEATLSDGNRVEKSVGATDGLLEMAPVETDGRAPI